MPVTPVRRVDASNPISSDHRRRPDDAEARLEGGLVDPDPLDRAGRGPLAAGDLRTLERRAGRRGGGEQPVARAQDDLGVRADVDDQRDLVREIRRLGQDHSGRVRADVARDAREQVDPRAGMARQVDLGGLDPDGAVCREGEGRRAEGRRVDPEQQVMHDRVADDRELEDVLDGARRPATRARDEARDGLPDHPGHLRRPALVEHRVRDAAHEVLAEPDLGVHHAVGGEDLAGRRGPRGARRSSSIRCRARRRASGRAGQARPR